jgi:hypothetical protein
MLLDVFCRHVAPHLKPDDVCKAANALGIKITEHMPDAVDNLIKERLRVSDVPLDDRLRVVNAALEKVAKSLSAVPAKFRRNYTVVHMAAKFFAFGDIRPECLVDIHGGRGIESKTLCTTPMYILLSMIGGTPMTHALRYIALSWTDSELSVDTRAGFDLMTGPLPRETDLTDVLWVE